MHLGPAYALDDPRLIEVVLACALLYDARDMVGRHFGDNERDIRVAV